MSFSIIVLIVFFAIILLANAIKIFPEYERGVLFRLGRYVGVRGPGLVLIIPIIDRIVRVPLRVMTMDVPPQDIITKDNVSVSVNAVVYFRVVDPAKAVIEVQDYIYATSQMAQTTLRSTLGAVELDELLARREKLNEQLRSIIDEATDPWGIKVTSVEIKAVDLPERMKRAMARQAEAERERRAKVIGAEGEFQASQKFYEAAVTLAKEPASLQLRFLHTLSEISSEKTSTIIFPVPLELLKPFFQNK